VESYNFFTAKHELKEWFRSNIMNIVVITKADNIKNQLTMHITRR